MITSSLLLYLCSTAIGVPRPQNFLFDDDAVYSVGGCFMHRRRE